MTAPEPQPSLFDVDALVAMGKPGEPGRVERALIAAIRKASDVGTLIEEDLGLIGSALAGARALDVADRGGPKGGPYAVAALLTPYRETLHALRLPAAVEPSEEPRNPAAGQTDTSDWLSGHFGTAE